MRHRHGYRKLGRNTNQRKALLKGLAVALFENGRITTTVPRAKELRRYAEKLITIAKRDPRTGDYNTLGVIVREHKNTQGKKLGKLKAGEYQLYIAVKRVHYEFKIKAEKGG